MFPRLALKLYICSPQIRILLDIFWRFLDANNTPKWGQSSTLSNCLKVWSLKLFVFLQFSYVLQVIRRSGRLEGKLSVCIRPKRTWWCQVMTKISNWKGLLRCERKPSPVIRNSRSFLDMSRKFLEISRNFLEMSRNFLECLGISCKILWIS